MAGLAEIADGAGRPGWLTHVCTDDVDTTSRLVVEAGGTVLRPAIESGGRGRSAVYADSLGAVFGVWQRGTAAGVAFAGAQVVDEPGAVTWGEVVTRDRPATAIGSAAYIADPTGGTLLVIEPRLELVAALG